MGKRTTWTIMNVAAAGYREREMTSLEGKTETVKGELN